MDIVDFVSGKLAERVVVCSVAGLEDVSDRAEHGVRPHLLASAPNNG